MDQLSLNKLTQRFFAVSANTRLLILSLFVLILLNTLLGYNQQSNQQQYDGFIEEYGQALGDALEDNLVLALDNNDLISLRGLLNKLTEKKYIYSTTIYTLENKVLVQASKPNIDPYAINKAHAINQALSLDGKLLGSLQITLNKNSKPPYLWWLLFNLFIIGVLTYFRKDQQATPTLASVVASQPEMPAEEAEPQAPSPPPPLPKARCYLILHCDGLTEIYQRLSAEMRNQQFHQLQTAIKNVLTFYSGEQLLATRDSFVLAFEEAHQLDCLFKAVCCGHLITSIAKEQQWMLKVSALITQQYQAQESTESIFIKPSLTQEKNLLIHSSCTLDEQLLERIVIQSLSEQNLCKFNQINAIQAPYQDLLNNQLKRLTETRQTESTL